MVEFGTNAADFWTVSPGFCPLSFACSPKNPTMTAISEKCEFQNSSGKVTFDEVSGRLSITTHDLVAFKPGAYAY